jgi:hypothetical protein
VFLAAFCRRGFGFSFGFPEAAPRVRCDPPPREAEDGQGGHDRCDLRAHFSPLLLRRKRYQLPVLWGRLVDARHATTIVYSLAFDLG